MNRRIYCDKLIDDDTDMLILGNVVLRCIDEERRIVQQNNADVELIQQDLVGLNDVIRDFNSVISYQGEEVKEAEQHAERADVDIIVGTKILEKTEETAAAVRQKKIAAKVVITAIGAGIGALVAGPVGFAISLKIGAITTGLGTALGAGVATII